jgi:glucosyl-dolichyl phosphate glucuronosyltransferase
MKLSVAICTWNRSRLLFQTLTRMATSLRVPDGTEWELLVVNNSCTDDTDPVIDSFRDRLPIRRLFQPEQGLSRARNLAVEEARGDYLVWTDDDVLVDAGWLEAYASAFRRWPDAAVFGGPIDPWFAAEPPAWLVETWPMIRVAYAVLDLGPEAIPLTAERLPFGANLAFRTEVQRRFPYDTRLGNCGEGRIGGEETRVVRSILQAGGTGRWVPGARVRHFIPPERMSVEYLRSYHRGRGRRLHFDGQRRQRGVLSWLARAIVGEVRYRVGRMVANARIWVRGLCASSVAWGYLEGVWKPEPPPAESARALAVRAEAMDMSLSRRP